MHIVSLVYTMVIGAKEEIKTWECNFKQGSQQGFTQRVTFEQKTHEGGEGGSMWASWERALQVEAQEL